MKLTKAALLFTLASVEALAQVNVGEQKPEASVPFNMTTVTTFELPWRIAFLPDGRMLITEKIGPVLSVMRVKTLDDAIELVNRSPFGNATSIFTTSGKAAREYSSRCEAGMVGVNVGVAAPMAFFPFAGWKNSFFGDLHAHGKDAIAFYTEQKVIMSRWF